MHPPLLFCFIFLSLPFITLALKCDNASCLVTWACLIHQMEDSKINETEVTNGINEPPAFVLEKNEDKDCTYNTTLSVAPIDQSTWNISLDTDYAYYFYALPENFIHFEAGIIEHSRDFTVSVNSEGLDEVPRISNAHTFMTNDFTFLYTYLIHFANGVKSAKKLSTYSNITYFVAVDSEAMEKPKTAVSDNVKIKFWNTLFEKLGCDPKEIVEQCSGDGCTKAKIGTRAVECVAPAELWHIREKPERVLDISCVQSNWKIRLWNVPVTQVQNGDTFKCDNITLDHDTTLFPETSNHNGGGALECDNAACLVMWICLNDWKINETETTNDINKPPAFVLEKDKDCGYNSTLSVAPIDQSTWKISLETKWSDYFYALPENFIHFQAKDDTNFTVSVNSEGLDEVPRISNAHTFLTNDSTYVHTYFIHFANGLKSAKTLSKYPNIEWEPILLGEKTKTVVNESVKIKFWNTLFEKLGCDTKEIVEQCNGDGCTKVQIGTRTVECVAPAELWHTREKPERVLDMSCVHSNWKFRLWNLTVIQVQNGDTFKCDTITLYHNTTLFPETSNDNGGISKYLAFIGLGVGILVIFAAGVVFVMLKRRGVKGGDDESASLK